MAKKKTISTQQAARKRRYDWSRRSRQDDLNGGNHLGNGQALWWSGQAVCRH